MNMSSQDQVERALKEIHLAFSKCEIYNGDPGRVIVDRQYFIDLMDQLNQGIYEMMEQYEQTRLSRESAEHHFRKRGDAIVEDASQKAEEIYAASVLYTADALGQIRSMIDQANSSMDEIFTEFRRELQRQKAEIRRNETELQGRLADMADGEKYLSVISQIKKDGEKAREEAERARAQKPDAFSRVPAGGSASREKAAVHVNQNAAYFKWREDREQERVARRAVPYPSEEEIDRQKSDPFSAETKKENAGKEGAHDKPASSSAGGVLRSIIFGKEN